MKVNSRGCTLLVLLLVALCCNTASSQITKIRKKGYCAMRGICGKSPYMGKYYVNCPYNGPALKPDFSLAELCPQYQDLSCCSKEQFETLVEQVHKSAVVLERCPACYENFVDFFCAFTCSPDQSVMVQVTKLFNGSEHKNVVAATEYSLSNAYATKVFDSCKNVKLASTGTSVMFGFNNSKTPHEFFRFVGHENPPDYSPFQINMNYRPERSRNETDLIHVCNTTDPILQCSCTDCPPVCPHHAPFTKKVKLPHWHLDYFGGDMDWDWLHMLFYTMFLLMEVGALVLWVMMSVEQLEKMDRPVPPSRAFFRVLVLVIGAVVTALVFTLAISAMFVSHARPSKEEQADTTYMLDSYFSRGWAAAVISLPVFLLVLITVAYGPCLSRVQTLNEQAMDTDEYIGSPYSPPDSDLVIPGTGFSSVDTYGSTDMKEDMDGGFESPSDSDAPLTSHSDDKQLPCSKRFFGAVGAFTARRPWTTIGLCVLFIMLCCIGFLRFRVETDPVKLWSPPGSTAQKQKDKFDDAFTPFYRIENIIVNPKKGSLFDPKVIIQLKTMQDFVENMTITHKGREMNISHLCFKPILGRGCLVQSIHNYWEEKRTLIPRTVIAPWWPEQWVKNDIQECAQDNTNDKCRGKIGVPTFPYTVMGGYPEVLNGETPNYLESTHFITTYLLRNSDDVKDAAEKWENKFLDIVKDKKRWPLLNVVYSAQRSVQDELKRGAYQDIPTVIISYAAMFVYISFALGSLRCPARNCAVSTKFLLGFCSILMVLMSIAGAIGICSAIGIEATPIISEVIPFLVLAIGIDNVFLILNTFHAQPVSWPLERRMATAMQSVGVSITLASTSEAVAFMLGVLTRMPAVKAFAFYAAVAILVDFGLQITMLCAMVVLDERRVQRGQADCVPCVTCIPVGSTVTSDDWDAQLRGSLAGKGVSGGRAGLVDEKRRVDTLENELLYDPVAAPQGAPEYFDPDLDAIGARADAPGLMNGSGPTAVDDSSCLSRCMAERFVPLLLTKVVQAVVIVVFVGGFFVLLGAGLRNSQLGLDQSTALPDDSYLQAYFDDVSNVLRVGPPVYFVVPEQGLDYSLNTTQNMICGIQNCDPFSLVGILSEVAEDPNSYISQSPISWIDDYLSWLVTRGLCCRENRQKSPPEYCPPNPLLKNCTQCLSRNEIVYGRPAQEDFHHYLHMFMFKSQCNSYCGSCGWGHFHDALLIDNEQQVGNNRFQTYHSVLKTQDDFINALKNARHIADRINERHNIGVYPYSVFYVFFEQYLYIEGVMALTTGLALGGIFLLCLVLLQNLWASLITLICIIMVLGDLLGTMAWWNVEINAVSVVNFVMAIGISVEFCVHITVTFMRTKGTRESRVWHAMRTTGASVVSGITLTKLSGVAVLAFARSELFRIYYFRMYASIVFYGALHGLIFLPVVLSLAGPPTRSKKMSCCSNFFACSEPTKPSKTNNKTGLLDTPTIVVDEDSGQSYHGLSDDPSAASVYDSRVSDASAMNVNRGAGDDLFGQSSDLIGDITFHGEDEDTYEPPPVGNQSSMYSNHGDAALLAGRTLDDSEEEYDE